jgi:hypothetical protein
MVFFKKGVLVTYSAWIRAYIDVKLVSFNQCRETMMKKNVGSVDRGVRLVAGAAIIGAGVYFSSLWGAVGLVLIATALMGWCPPYALFGISSCKTK